jgi:hypothetical protein
MHHFKTAADNQGPNELPATTPTPALGRSPIVLVGAIALASSILTGTGVLVIMSLSPSATPPARVAASTRHDEPKKPKEATPNLTHGQSQTPEIGPESLERFCKAAEQGDEDAQYNLGVMYAEGQGVPRNDVAAYAWMNLAAAGGHKEAKVQRDRLETRMTRGEIAEAQRIAAEFRPKVSKADEQD